MKIFDFDGPLMTVIRKLWAVVLSGVLFLLCSVPVVTAGMSFAALYDTARRNLSDNRGYVFSCFFESIKKNWRQTLPAGAVMAGIFIFLEFDVRIMKAFLENGRAIGNMYVLFRVFQVLLAVYAVWVLTQITCFENSLKQILKNAVYLAVRHLGVSVGIFLLLVFCGVVIYVMPVSVIFMPVVVTWLMTSLIGKVYKEYGA